MLLEARNLSKSFKKGRVRAVRDVSFGLDIGKTLGVVGESGSGKSTLMKLILRLLRPEEGEIHFEGTDITSFQEKNLRSFRKKTQVIFQHPYLSLDPRMTVGAILKEPFLLDGERDPVFLKEKIKALLSQVELPVHFASRMPHELSGGECQRVAIARAISREPELLICDEPVSALDLLAQARILNLLLKLQREKNVANLFVTHDLRVARHMSDEVMVMKDGEVCEMAPRDEIFSHPKHPYTQSLIQQIPC